MVAAGDEGPHFPFNTAVKFDRQPDGAVGLVLAEG